MYVIFNIKNTKQLNINCPHYPSMWVNISVRDPAPVPPPVSVRARAASQTHWGGQHLGSVLGTPAVHHLHKWQHFMPAWERLKKEGAGNMARHRALAHTGHSSWVRKLLGNTCASMHPSAPLQTSCQKAHAQHLLQAPRQKSRQPRQEQHASE